jgi:hypothetical protein
VEDVVHAVDRDRRVLAAKVQDALHPQDVLAVSAPRRVDLAIIGAVAGAAHGKFGLAPIRRRPVEGAPAQLARRSR